MGRREQNTTQARTQQGAGDSRQREGEAPAEPFEYKINSGPRFGRSLTLPDGISQTEWDGGIKTPRRPERSKVPATRGNGRARLRPSPLNTKSTRAHGSAGASPSRSTSSTDEMGPGRRRPGCPQATTRGVNTYDYEKFLDRIRKSSKPISPSSSKSPSANTASVAPKLRDMIKKSLKSVAPSALASPGF